MGHKVGTKMSIATRLKKRDAMNIYYGHKPGYIEEALDLYLEGFSAADLAENYGVSKSSMHKSLAVAALFRLMAAHSKERIEEIAEDVA